MFGWIRRRHKIQLSGQRFFDAPWSGGLMLVVGVLLAMLLANLPWTSEAYHRLLQTDLSLNIHNDRVSWAFPRGLTVETFINDILMVVFFFLVGLEIKREVVHGELSSPRRALLPVLAAAGGMLVPALIYFGFNAGGVAAHGWGIPTATDIAFAIGILSLFGDRVPLSLKIFLTALAVVDDLGAILVIALFYGGQINFMLLGIAMLILAGLYFLNRLGETNMLFYLLPAALVWTFFYYSGIHATLSGVVVAMFIPTRPRYSKNYFAHKINLLRHSLVKADSVPDDFPNEEHRDYLRQMTTLAHRSVGMSYRLEHALSPYVTFLIMPLFALANAGVTIGSPENLLIFRETAQTGGAGLGIFFGLLAGKPLGIALVSFLAVKLRLAQMPAGASWRLLVAVACLGGIGFTMSIFVDTLAFSDPHLVEHGKIAILFGSLASAALGTVAIMLFTKKKR